MVHLRKFQLVLVLTIKAKFLQANNFFLRFYIGNKNLVKWCYYLEHYFNSISHL